MLQRLFTYLISGMLVAAANLSMAQSIERKIIVEKGQFSYLTVDPETQLAHLHCGSVRSKFAFADDRIVPTGRSSEEPINPLSFSLHGTELISINWILNAMNSRYEAIRNTDLSFWQKVRPEWHTEEWAEASFAQPVLAPNLPWQRMLEDNNQLSNCFFDLNGEGKQLIMAVCNQGTIRFSRWNGSNWIIKKAIPYTGKDYFTLLTANGKIILLSNDGSLLRYDEQRNQLRVFKKGLQKNLLVVEDHDRQKWYLIGPQALESPAASSFESIVNESGTEINF